MYQENKWSTEWLKIILRLVIIILLVLLTMKFVIILNNNNVGKKSTKLTNNLNYVNDCAKKYFDEKNIPKKVGETKEYLVKDILSIEQIDYMNKNYEKCEYDKSYIKITRLDKEYQIKTILNCSGETNYMNSFVELPSNAIIIKPTTTTTTTAKKVRKTTKTTIKYRISFNTNGGDYIEDVYVKENTKVNVIPKREGYTFVGWYNNGTLFDKPIDKDYVLTAKWTKN